jgi:acetyl esterase/lipase
VTTEEDDLRNRNDITLGAGSAVVDLSGAELTGTPADREISPAASAAADGTEDPQAPRPNDGSLRVDEDTPLTAVMRADEFEGFGNLIFPASDRITEGMTVSDTARLLPFHSNVNPADVARTVDRMLIAVRSGQLTFHPLYSEDQIADDPDKAVVGLFFFRGGTNAPLSIISAGGGFSYVGSIHEGFPHAQTIADHGENAFVLNYRTGSGGRLAAEDLAVAIDFAFANAHELDVDPTGYALWGSSAGARMAAVLGSHGTIAFGQGHRPRPSAVIMAYTGHSDISGTVPPTFAVVGSDDVIAPSWLVRQHIDRLRLAGVRTEFHAFPNIGHGFGLGTGTAAEGWIDDALAFWRTNRIQRG